MTKDPSDRPFPWALQALFVMMDLMLGKLGDPEEPRAIRRERNRWLFLMVFAPPALWVMGMQKLLGEAAQGPILIPAVVWVFGCVVWLVRVYGRPTIRNRDN